MAVDVPEPDLPLPVQGGAGAAPSPMQNDLLNQAYTNMITGNYEIAERLYRSLTEMQPGNLAAREGVLWAGNSMGKYGNSLRLSKQLIGQYPQHGAFYNYRAYALLMRKHYPESRYYYQKGLQLEPGNPLANQISNEGLAFSYLRMGDYVRYRRFLSQASVYSGIPVEKPKPVFRSTVYYKMSGEDKTALGFSQSVSYRRVTLNLAHEDFKVDRAYFRSVSKAEVNTQTPYIDLLAQIRFLYAEEQPSLIYPAQQVGIKLSPKLYVGTMAFRPAAFASYGSYYRFGVQQLSMLPTVYWWDMSASYAFHYVYMDYEKVDSDSTHIAQQFQLTKELPMGVSLGLYYGIGNDTWLVDISGVVMDKFSPTGDNYGVSLAYPFLSRFSLYGFCQQSGDDDLWYVSLTGRY